MLSKKAKRLKDKPTRYINRTAKRDYEILDTFEAGISLRGDEVKAIRNQGIKLEGSYVKIVDGEVRLIGAHISQYAYASKKDDYNPTRTRTLLLHKAEILKIRTKLAANPRLTIVPLKVYAKGPLLKIEIALGRGLKSWQVKKVEAGKTEKRRIEKEIRSNY